MSLQVSKIRTTALALLIAGAAVVPAHAAVFLPNSEVDAADGVCDSHCSLRDAVLAANQADGPDVIVLGPGIWAVDLGAGGEDLGSSGDLDIRDDLTIVGQSAESTVLQGRLDRVLDIQAGVSAEIIGVTIRGGNAAGNGGGIRNAGQLTLSRVVVTANQATGGGGGISSIGSNSSLTVEQSAITVNNADAVGGGISAGSQMTLTDSTVSGNTAGGNGGGIHTADNTDGTIVNATITGNRSATQGGGLYTVTTPFLTTDRPVLRNTILAGNTAPADRDCGGAPASGGENLVGVGGSCIGFTAVDGDFVGTAAAPLDPKLGALTNNGGTTPTHALLAGSPALNRGLDCGDVDQRGQSRNETACDIGAFEAGSACLTGGPTLCLNDDRFKVTVTFKTAQGATGSGQAVELTDDTGYFWFFDRENVELTIKALDGCGFNNRYWVFVSGLTNIEVTVTVTDTATGQVKTYTNPQGRNFRPVLDTTAFATCGA